MNLQIRKATKDDVLTLSKLCATTYIDTYVPDRPHFRHEMENYVKKNYSAREIDLNLLNSNIIYLIAEDNNSSVGYCKIILNESPEGENAEWIHLDEIYVVKSKIGKGIGKKLLQEFYKIAKSKKARVAWLGVWDGNSKAINFYQKNGFEAFGSREFKIDISSDIDLLMKRNI